MKIKTATLLGLFGAILSIAQSVFYFLINMDIIKLVPDDMDYEKANQIYKTFNICNNSVSAFSALTLAIFFLVLHNRQK